MSIVYLLLPAGLLFAQDELLGWNERPVPKKIVVCDSPASIDERMLLASLSGLSAQAVSNGEYDEMVWEDIPSESYGMLYKSAMEALDPKNIRRTDVWSLLADYQRSGVVKGYVIYKKDTSSGRMFSARKSIDMSANVATVYAGVLRAVIVEESLEPAVKKLGLKKLKDCRQITPEQCFQELKGQLNNRSAVSMDPKSHNCREYAIAEKLMVYYGVNDFAEKVLEWVEPLSPIVGWNCGDEFSHTFMVSRWGHFNTASDKCENMMVLAAASAVMNPVRIKEQGPSDIDYLDFSSFHSYLLSDGDNMQWTNGSFLTDKNFYASAEKEKFSMNWTSCPCNLSVMSIPAWNYIATSKPDNNSIVEYGGGYFYPDLFASCRSDRKVLLTKFAGRVGKRMNELGITLFGVICKDVHSREAEEAFAIFAREIKDLTGIIAIQYYPYEIDGEPRWFDNGHGVDIPVVTAKYSIWDAVDPNRPTAGTPEYVSELINRNVMGKARGGQQAELSFTIVHAWSSFNGWNSSNKVTTTQAATAAFRSSTLLVDDVKPVSLNELIWRIRMRYRPDQTNKILNEEN